MVKVKYEVKYYENNANFSVDDSMLGFVFTNLGTAPVYLSGYELQPFDSLDTRYNDEQDVTNWVIIFRPESGTKKIQILIKSKA